MAIVTIKNLLEAGVHFGHKTRRWNPKMKKFIFEARDGIYILDLQKTLEQLQIACNFVREKVTKGRSVLFVGTKKQAKESIDKAGTDTKMHFVNERWLGGTLTNNITIRKSIRRLRYLDGLFEDGTSDGLPKKEISSINRERARLHKNLDGIKNMAELPGVVFIIDPKREKIATAEARKLNIPIIGLIDTNCDPDMVDFPIPGNDDAIKSVSLITSIFSKIVQEALQEREKLGIVVEDTSPELEEVEKPPPRPERKPPQRRRRTGGRGPTAKKPVTAEKSKAEKAVPKPKPATETAVEKPVPKPQPAPETAVEEPKAEKPVAAAKEVDASAASSPVPEPEKAPKPIESTLEVEAAPQEPDATGEEPANEGKDTEKTENPTD